MEATGQPIASDGEQRASSFVTYPLVKTLRGTELADNLAPDSQLFTIFDDGHHRQLPRLTSGPFRYQTYAAQFVEQAVPLAILGVVLPPGYASARGSHFVLSAGGPARWLRGIDEVDAKGSAEDVARGGLLCIRSLLEGGAQGGGKAHLEHRRRFVSQRRPPAARSGVKPVGGVAALGLLDRGVELLAGQLGTS